MSHYSATEPLPTDAPLSHTKATVTLWWRALAYRNKAAEWTLWLLLLSGLPLWTLFDVPWVLQRLCLAVHALLGLTAFILWVMPFWLRHRQLLSTSQKRALKRTGQLLDLLLLLVTLSGFGLFFIGNRGEAGGQWLLWVHLYSSLVLAPVLLKHAWRWSVLRLDRLRQSS